jgi:hypothetical protein
MSLTKLFLAGKNLIIPARESLLSDIPPRDGKIGNLFLQCKVNIKDQASDAYLTNKSHNQGSIWNEKERFRPFSI